MEETVHSFLKLYDLDVSSDLTTYIISNHPQVALVKWLLDHGSRNEIQNRPFMHYESVASAAFFLSRYKLVTFLIEEGVFNEPVNGHVVKEFIINFKRNIGRSMVTGFSLLRDCIRSRIEVSIGFKKVFLMGTSPRMSGFSYLLRMIADYAGVPYGRSLRNILECETFLFGDHN